MGVYRNENLGQETTDKKGLSYLEGAKIKFMYFSEGRGVGFWYSGMN